MSMSLNRSTASNLLDYILRLHVLDLRSPLFRFDELFKFFFNQNRVIGKLDFSETFSLHSNEDSLYLSKVAAPTKL